MLKTPLIVNVSTNKPIFSDGFEKQHDCHPSERIKITLLQYII